MTEDEFAVLLGHPVPDRHKHVIDRNITFSELCYGRSPIGWIVWLVLTLLKRVSDMSGKPNLNILFIYNMPLRALAKMTDGAFSMGMVDGLVMEFRGFWGIGIGKLAVEAVRNAVRKQNFEKLLKEGPAEEKLS